MNKLISLGVAAGVAIIFYLWSNGVIPTIGNAIMSSFTGKVGL